MITFSGTGSLAACSGFDKGVMCGWWDIKLPRAPRFEIENVLAFGIDFQQENLEIWSFLNPFSNLT